MIRRSLVRTRRRSLWLLVVLGAGIVAGCSRPGQDAPDPSRCSNGSVEWWEVCDSDEVSCATIAPGLVGTASCDASCKRYDASTCAPDLAWFAEQLQADAAWCVAEQDADGDGRVTRADCRAPASSGFSGAPGVSCWDLNGNGVPDASEDLNRDGLFDALDCKAIPAAPLAVDRFVEVGQENIGALERVVDGVTLRVGEDIELGVSTNALYLKRGLRWVGAGTIRATDPETTLELGYGVQVYGLTFESITLEGDDVSFFGCEFGEGTTLEISDAAIHNSKLVGGIEVSQDTWIDHSWIVDAQVESVRSELVVRGDSKIDRSTVLGLHALRDTEIEDSVVGVEDTVSGNMFEDSLLRARASRDVQILSNTFDGTHPDAPLQSYVVIEGADGQVRVAQNRVLADGQGQTFLRVESELGEPRDQHFIDFAHNVLDRVQGLDVLGDARIVAHQNVLIRQATLGIEHAPAASQFDVDNIIAAPP